MNADVRIHDQLAPGLRVSADNVAALLRRGITVLKAVGLKTLDDFGCLREFIAHGVKPLDDCFRRAGKRDRGITESGV